MSHKEIIGILGGTFNPIHYGHLRIAEELAETLDLDEVRFIPSANPPHKHAPSVSAQQRAEMVSIAIAGNPTFKLDTREIEREGASYMIDTLKSLREENRKSTLCLFMGSDAFCKLDTWHEWQQLLNYCHIIVVQRPNDNSSNGLNVELQSLLQAHYTEDIKTLQEQFSGYITMLKVSALDISSTRLRQLISTKESPRYLLPDAVLDYIKLNKLYL